LSAAYFGHELREFRAANGLTRKDMAILIGVSDYTVRAWENGKVNPQSSTIWRIVDHLNTADMRRFSRIVDLSQLRKIIESFARSLDLSPVESNESKLLRIERTLTGSILKAAQTDFQYDPSKRQLEPIPFVSDLRLFEASSKLEIFRLLENASDAAGTVVGKLQDVNIEQRYLSDTLSDYKSECEREVPNPRILARKGDLIRYVYSSEDISGAVNRFLLKEIEQFIEIHNELMRGLFGEALSAARMVTSDKVDDAILEDASGLFIGAVKQLEAMCRESIPGDPTLHIEVPAIVADVGKEVAELEVAVSQANDPNSKSLRVARLKVAAFQGALLIGRILLRTTSAVLTHGAAVASIAGIIEVIAPGSIRAAYELLKTHIPDLPSLPII